jgi:hypothetical protein
MYVKVENEAVSQYPYTIGQLKKENPNTSFPENISDETLALFGVFNVQVPAYPHQDHTKNVTEELPVFVDNQWTASWIVTDATQEEIEKRIDQKSITVRAERNKLLLSTDWTQVADAPVDKAAWSSYRQALRDVPSQTGFPWAIEWPVKP